MSKRRGLVVTLAGATVIVGGSVWGWQMYTTKAYTAIEDEYYARLATQTGGLLLTKERSVRGITPTISFLVLAPDNIGKFENSLRSSGYAVERSGNGLTAVDDKLRFTANFQTGPETPLTIIAERSK